MFKTVCKNKHAAFASFNEYHVFWTYYYVFRNVLRQWCKLIFRLIEKLKKAKQKNCIDDPITRIT